MKKIFLILFAVIAINVKAQQVYPLNTSVLSVPEYSYFKDTKNELDPFVGKWKINYKGRSIFLSIEKQIKVPKQAFDKNYYGDQIVVRYEVKDSNGKMLESTLSKDFTKDKTVRLMIRGFKIDEQNRVMAIFYGGKCSLGNGLVFLGKPTANQLSWSYRPQAIVLTSDMEERCRGEVYLPVGENLIFTKQ